MTEQNKKRESGFSLIELLVVVAVIVILAVIVLNGFGIKSKTGKLILDDTSTRIRERRNAAVRLLQPNKEGLTILPLISIDFADSKTTAPIEAGDTDLNRDGIDDYSNQPTTVYRSNSWNYIYRGKEQKLPNGWQLASSAADLGQIPQIPGTELTTVLRFDENGRVADKPSAAPYGIEKEAAFFVIYFIDSTKKYAVAIGVHSTGLTENWTYNSEEHVWTGSGGRKRE